MTMTDPIADMLTRIRNASRAYHETVSMPYSKLKVRIADILKAEGYILDWREEEAEVGSTLVLELKYSSSRERAISGIRRISKPGLRVYAKSTNLPKVLGGLGEVTETPIPHWYRQLRHGRIGGGADEIQRMLISRAILKQGVSLWEA